jgi:hypothetical protein
MSVAEDKEIEHDIEESDDDIEESEDDLDPLGPDDPYPWAADDDERRRAFVLERLTLDGAVPTLSVLAEIHAWLKEGASLAADSRKRLRPVK